MRSSFTERIVSGVCEVGRKLVPKSVIVAMEGFIVLLGSHAWNCVPMSLVSFHMIRHDGIWSLLFVVFRNYRSMLLRDENDAMVRLRLI